MEYQVDMKDNTLIVRTASFTSERGSMLHGGIFNRELASSLAAGAVLILAGLYAAASMRIRIYHYLLALFLFCLLFIVFRSYVFRERFLETSIDKIQGEISFSSSSVIGSRRKKLPLADLKDVRLEYVSHAPLNTDGIQVVEKIALQHGTVIPGFGERKEYYSVLLDFHDEAHVIFSSRKSTEAERLLKEVGDFLTQKAVEKKSMDLGLA